MMSCPNTCKMALQLLASHQGHFRGFLYPINLHLLYLWQTEVHFATHFDEVFNVAFGEQVVS